MNTNSCINMNNLGKRVLASIQYRLLRRRLGLDSGKGEFAINIGGYRIHLDVQNEELEVQQYELHKIVLEDCYLIKTQRDVRTIVDVGGNMGFFALACADQFPDSEITVYEPNPNAFQCLCKNTKQLGVSAINAAVGSSSGYVNLGFRENSLFSVTVDDADGDTKKVGFPEIISDMESVDILKLDCEGAEWEILESDVPWEKVKFLTMEYHLWAREGSTIDQMRKLIEGCGFVIEHQTPSQDGTFGMLHATHRAWR